MTSKRQIRATQLQDWLTKVSESAKQSGHLKPGQTSSTLVHDRLDYEVRTLVARRKKPRKQSEHSPESNPFLPFEPEMYVGHTRSGHVILLNKFNIVHNHYLMVTPEFEPQENPLKLKEFEAISEVHPAFRQLIFYNSGPEAGASQPHRHIQSIPIKQLPISPAIDRLPDTPERMTSLPYDHLICRLNSPTAEGLFDCYHDMISKLKLCTPNGDLSPYNLLITEDWMMVVPRSQGRYERISINALGFAGLLLVKDQATFDQLVSIGPSTILDRLSGH